MAPKHDSEKCRCFAIFIEFISEEHCVYLFYFNRKHADGISVFSPQADGASMSCTAVCQVHHINRKLMHEVRFLENEQFFSLDFSLNRCMFNADWSGNHIKMFYVKLWVVLCLDFYLFQMVNLKKKILRCLQQTLMIHSLTILRICLYIFTNLITNYMIHKVLLLLISQDKTTHDNFLESSVSNIFFTISSCHNERSSQAAVTITSCWNILLSSTSNSVSICIYKWTVNIRSY